MGAWWWSTTGWWWLSRAEMVRGWGAAGYFQNQRKSSWRIEMSLMINERGTRRQHDHLDEETVPQSRNTTWKKRKDCLGRRWCCHEKGRSLRKVGGSCLGRGNMHKNMLEFCSFKWAITKFNPSNFPPFQNNNTLAP